MARRLRVGVIGTGAMGADHIRTLHRWVPAARVVAVQDLDVDRAKQLAADVGADVAESADDLIDAGTVDALIIASPDPTHAPLARAAIAAGLPVLCEKPLGTDPQESRSVVDAEVAADRRLVTVGFMRRFDPGYLRLKDAIAAGRVGVPRLVHNVHRNRVGHPSATTEGIVVNSMIHELDVVPWLLDSPIVQIEVTSPVAEGFRDPQLAVLRHANGALSTVEVFIEAAYGYDVRCEVVGTAGTAALVPPAVVTHATGGVAGTEVPADFRPRFADAYRLELGAWANSVLDGSPVGPTAWDGHRATVIAAAGVASLHEGRAVPVPDEPRPSLYG
ncbi:inositol 2-dehydrogenase [Aeromicrobium phragmitis]|uniref:Inositol 2-dehydrogenase n=1 Tax=Aeromicrobium phragmitis TaxID=2478914 RepID=A0A3L8PK58_9ACTN|nr:Gfo/Idh/MocA family oxidoreductase [Aeromicrobium phragmitis]RLV55169.1 inositol 2-dehydrogenase [Aeromicrobium phragmitis]